MVRTFRIRVALACAAFAFGSFAFDAAAQDAVRPEVGNPLKAAQGYLKSGRSREALAEIAKAEAVSGRTANENFLITQMKGSAAHAAGDTDTAIRSFESVVDSGRISGNDKLRMMQAIAGLHYKNKNYTEAARWATRYRKEGGNDPSMRTVLLQSYFLANDCASVNKLVGDADNGRKVSEEDLQILANCHLKNKDTAGYVSAIEKLVVHYPKKEYWTDLLNRVQKKPGFSDRLALDVFRLKLVTGNLAGTADYMELAQLALQAGYPAEAKQVIDKAYAAGAFSESSKEADRQKRLKALVAKTADEQQKARDQLVKDAEAGKDGTDLVKVGVNYMYEGQADKGAALAEKGIKKGGLKRAEDAKLQLGEAMIQNGQRSKGIQVLKTVGGTDGTADLARLWVLHAQRS